MTENAAMMPHDLSKLVNTQLKLAEQAASRSESLRASLAGRDLAKAILEPAGERLAASVSASLLKAVDSHQSLINNLMKAMADRLSSSDINNVTLFDGPIGSALRARQGIEDAVATALRNFHPIMQVPGVGQLAVSSSNPFAVALQAQAGLRDSIAKAASNATVYSDFAGRLAATISAERGFSSGRRAEALVAQAVRTGFREVASAVDSEADDPALQFARTALRELAGAQAGTGQALNAKTFWNLLALFSALFTIWGSLSTTRQLESLTADHERLAAYHEAEMAARDSMTAVLAAIASMARWSAVVKRPSIVRSRPVRTSGAIGRLLVGTKVDVMARKKEWARVRYAQSDSLRTGWVENKLLTITEAE